MFTSKDTLLQVDPIVVVEFLRFSVTITSVIAIKIKINFFPFSIFFSNKIEIPYPSQAPS